MALERQHASSASMHLRLLATFWEAWRRYFSDSTCLVCLARSPSNNLICGHMICDTCVVICGSSEASDPWRFCIPHCPLCQRPNETTVTIQPPTAGKRVLSLEAAAPSKSALLQFLKDLQALTSLPCCSLRDQFDIVVGSNIGR